MFVFMWAVAPIALSGEYGKISRVEWDHQACAGASGNGAGDWLGGPLPPGQWPNVPQGCWEGFSWGRNECRSHKQSSMLSVNVGVLVKLLIKSFDGSFTSLVLVLQFPGREASAVVLCSSARLNAAVCCLHLCHAKVAAGLSVLLANWKDNFCA